MESPGTLYMLSTHLGIPEDIPVRSLELLRTADLLVFEEDKPARSFLKAAGVHRPYVKLSEHGQGLTIEDVESHLKSGKVVAYMSDQGTPNLSDPGRELTSIAYRLGAKVKVVPGPSSLTAAISACPFDCFGFHFLGFLPQSPEARHLALEGTKELSRPLIMMDTPYRLKHLVKSCADVLGKERRGFLALDITGANESFWLGSLGELAQKTSKLAEKINFILIIEAEAQRHHRKRRG